MLKMIFYNIFIFLSWTYKDFHAYIRTRTIGNFYTSIIQTSGCYKRSVCITLTNQIIRYNMKNVDACIRSVICSEFIIHHIDWYFNVLFLKLSVEKGCRFDYHLSHQADHINLTKLYLYFISLFIKRLFWSLFSGCLSIRGRIVPVRAIWWAIICDRLYLHIINSAIKCKHLHVLKSYNNTSPFALLLHVTLPSIHN